MIFCMHIHSVLPPQTMGGENFRGDVGESMFSNIWGGKIFSHLMGGKFSFFLTIIYIFYQFITDIIQNAWCTDT